MQFIRSWTSGGKLVIWSFKSLVAGELPNINPAEFTISLVPTQLQRLLDCCPNWLSRFQSVLLGGAPAWTELLNAARKHGIPLAPTYGMTETASQVATLKPEDFLGGNNSCGQVLPHAEITIGGNRAEILPPGEIGIINIKTDSLALGYYPESQTIAPQFTTDDLGFLDAQGYLHIVGRNSQKIITGGVNVFPAEIEAAIFATNLVSDVVVIGLPDSYWGEAVTAVYVARSPKILPEHLAAAIASTLSKFKQPKHWLPVPSLPRNSQGKINRQELLKINLFALGSEADILNFPPQITS
jgi:O-succinylbenzoic acid--CoA ligase